MTPKKELYALLVAIDKYEGDITLKDGIYFPPLTSCVPDSKRLKSYLENDPAYNAHVVLLANSEATKANVVKQFREHLGKARKDDVALFFYSGHGTQEWADTSAWTMDTDGRLECIVCYYDDDKDEFLLADKEMRFLIHELSEKKPHILALFDCCHSTDNTRNADPVKQEFSNVVEKRVPWSFPKRKWEHFIFSDKISRDDLKKKGEAALLPEGRHVQLSACESDESALEVDGRGVFTKALMQVLNASGGDVTYTQAHSRIRQYLKNVYVQKPHLYAGAADLELLSENFLDRPTSKATRATGELVYNEDAGWKLNLGAIHGIDDDNRQVTITDPSDEEGKIYDGLITKIEIDSCFVETSARLKTRNVYHAVVSGLLSKKIKLTINNENSPLKLQRKLLDSIMESCSTFIDLEDDESAAEYVIRTDGKEFIITKPFENTPLTSGVKTTATDELVKRLKHISRWEFLKDLSNKRGTYVLGDDSIKVEVTDEKSKQQLINDNDEVLIKYEEENGSWIKRIRVKLTNTSSVNVYCAVLHLSSSFGSHIGFLNPPVYMLEPGNSVQLATDNDPVLELELSESVKSFRMYQEMEFFKIVMSTEPFDVNELVLEPLPLPGEDASKSVKSQVKDATRSVKKRKPRGWTTRTITLIMKNPLMQIRKSTKPPGGGGMGDLISKSVDMQAVPKMQSDVDMISQDSETTGSDMQENAAESSPPELEMAAPVGSVDRDEDTSKKSESKPPGSAPPTTSKSREGQMEYDIPGQMDTGKTYVCKVNIAGNEVAAADMKISTSSVHSGIRVSDEMTVRLLDTSEGEHFDIFASSTERQGIFAGEVTSWLFSVKPKKSGNHPLLLKVTIHMDGRNKDVDILEKEIVVTSSATGEPPVKTDDITRILFISASPLDMDALRIGAETRQIREEIGLAARRDKFVFTINLGVTTRTLSRAILQEDPTIVHFSGHGEEEGLCLESEAGVSKLVENKALGLLFSNFSDKIKCVILNACFSEAQAKAIAEYIPYVIGMKKEVKDSIALAFSVGFYQALTDGEEIEKAFKMGLAGMAMVAEGEQDVAVLLKKEK